MACGDSKKPKKTNKTLSQKHKDAIKKAKSGKKLSQAHKDAISKGRKDCAKK